MEQIQILLSTYNGEKYIAEQLESIFHQSYPNWSLLIRDDGSKDRTLEIIQSFMDKYPDKITLLSDSTNVGACKSFEKLLQYSTSDYVMFSDQDDIWLPNKVEEAYLQISKLEKRDSEIAPTLVHFDLQLVNERLESIASSMWRYSKLNGLNNKLSNLIVQNNATGCTFILNKKLRELSLPIPNVAIMHDWWVNIVASIHGGTFGIPSSYILYRQHSQNTLGAKRYKMISSSSWAERTHKWDSIKKTIAQAKKLQEHQQDYLSPSQQEVLLKYSELFFLSRLKRIYTVIRYQLLKTGFIRSFFYLILLFLARKEAESD